MLPNPNPFVVGELLDGRRITINTKTIVYIEDDATTTHVCAVKLNTGESFKLTCSMEEFVYSMYDGQTK